MNVTLWSYTVFVAARKKYQPAHSCVFMLACTANTTHNTSWPEPVYGVVLLFCFFFVSSTLFCALRQSDCARRKLQRFEYIFPHAHMSCIFILFLHLVFFNVITIVLRSMLTVAIYTSNTYAVLYIPFILFLLKCSVQSAIAVMLFDIWPLACRARLLSYTQNPFAVWPQSPPPRALWTMSMRSELINGKALCAFVMHKMNAFAGFLAVDGCKQQTISVWNCGRTNAYFYGPV